MPVTTRIIRYLQPGGARHESGATAIITAIIITALLSVGALTIDYGQASLVRRQTQNAADATAQSIAERCARQAVATGMTTFPVSCYSPVKAEDQVVVEGNAPSGRLSQLRVSGGRRVTVASTKPVEFALAPIFGAVTDEVRSSATAEWTNLRPVSGEPILPLGVSYCTWKNRSATAGTTNESAVANRVALRTDPLQSVRNLAAPLTEALPVDSLLNSLGTNNRDTCTDVDGSQLLTLQGAVWLTGETVVTDTVRGLFGYGSSECKLRTSNSTYMFVGALQGAAVVPQSCYQKLGNQVKVGQTILLPIYKPADPQGLLWTGVNKLGLRAEACVTLLQPANKTCLTVPPQLGVQVVGYAPFKITGYLYPGKDQRDASVACSTNPISMTVDGILSVVGGLLNFALKLVLQGLLGLNPITTSISCNGLQGYFTKSFTKDPNFEYGTGGADFGAGLVRLVQ